MCAAVSDSSAENILEKVRNRKCSIQLCRVWYSAMFKILHSKGGTKYHRIMIPRDRFRWITIHSFILSLSMAQHVAPRRKGVVTCKAMVKENNMERYKRIERRGAGYLPLRSSRLKTTGCFRKLVMYEMAHHTLWYSCRLHLTRHRLVIGLTYFTTAKWITTTRLRIRIHSVLKTATNGRSTLAHQSYVRGTNKSVLQLMNSEDMILRSGGYDSVHIFIGKNIFSSTRRNFMEAIHKTS